MPEAQYRRDVDQEKYTNRNTHCHQNILNSNLNICITWVWLA